MGAILFSLKFSDIYKCTYWSRIESLKSITIINNLRHDIGLNLYKTIKHRITYKMQFDNMSLSLSWNLHLV